MYKPEFVSSGASEDVYERKDSARTAETRLTGGGYNGRFTRIELAHLYCTQRVSVTWLFKKCLQSRYTPKQGWPWYLEQEMETWRSVSLDIKLSIAVFCSTHSPCTVCKSVGQTPCQSAHLERVFVKFSHDRSSWEGLQRYRMSLTRGACAQDVEVDLVAVALCSFVARRRRIG